MSGSKTDNAAKAPKAPSISTEEEYAEVFGEVLEDLLEMARNARDDAEANHDIDPGTTVWAVQQCMESGADDYVTGTMAALCILTAPSDTIVPRIMALREYKTGLMSIAEPASTAGAGKFKH